MAATSPLWVSNTWNVASKIKEPNCSVLFHFNCFKFKCWKAIPMATVLDSTMLESYHMDSVHIDFSSKRRPCKNSQYLGVRAKGRRDWKEEDCRSQKTVLEANGGSSQLYLRVVLPVWAPFQPPCSLLILHHCWKSYLELLLDWCLGWGSNLPFAKDSARTHWESWLPLMTQATHFW